MTNFKQTIDNKTNWKRRLIFIIIGVLVIGLVMGGLIIYKQETTQEAEPTPLVIESTVDEDSIEFKEAVQKAVEEKLSGDVALTVYCEGVEDACYYGKIDVTTTAGGTVVIIRASSKVTGDNMEVGE